jgi:hypothetical protein
MIEIVCVLLLLFVGEVDSSCEKMKEYDERNKMEGQRRRFIDHIPIWNASTESEATVHKPPRTTRTLKVYAFNRTHQKGLESMSLALNAQWLLHRHSGPRVHMSVNYATPGR